MILSSFSDRVYNVISFILVNVYVLIWKKIYIYNYGRWQFIDSEGLKLYIYESEIGNKEYVKSVILKNFR